MPADAAPTKASVSGTVEAVDAGAGKITISHDPVESLKWPAMTMGFKATPEQVASVQLDQKVQFEFESRGMDATITQITPVKQGRHPARSATHARLSCALRTHTRSMSCLGDGHRKAGVL